MIQPFVIISIFIFVSMVGGVSLVVFGKVYSDQLQIIGVVLLLITLILFVILVILIEKEESEDE